MSGVGAAGSWRVGSAVKNICLFVIIITVILFFQDRVFMCRPGCPGACPVDQVSFELRSPASWVLGVGAHVTMPSQTLAILAEDSALPWQFTAICNFSTRGSDTLFWPLGTRYIHDTWYTYIHAGKHSLKKKSTWRVTSPMPTSGLHTCAVHTQDSSDLANCFSLYCGPSGVNYLGFAAWSGSIM